LNHVEQSEYVQFEHGPHRIHWRPVRGLIEPHAGVFDQHVDASELLDGIHNGCLAGLRICEITGRDDGIGSAHLLQFVMGARGEREFCSAPEKLQCASCANTFRCARDEDNFIVDSHAFQ